MTTDEPSRHGFDSEAASRDSAGDTDLTDIYLAAIEHPVLKRSDLLEAGFSEADVNDGLPLLESRGMIQRLDQTSWRVLPPDIVMPAFAARLEDQARAVRASAPGLHRVFERGQQRSSEDAPFGSMQVLTSVPALSQALARVVSTAQRTVHLLCSDTPLTRTMMDQPEETHRQPLLNSLGAPVRIKANYSGELLKIPTFPDYLKSRSTRGDEQRIIPGFTLTAAVNDTGMALVDLVDERGRTHGLLSTDAAVADGLQELISWTWRLAVPWQPTADNGEHPFLTAQEREVLQLLAAGASDMAIARHLKVSQRTVERRVRAMLDRLNATTRFQAGVLAARHELL